MRNLTNLTQVDARNTGWEVLVDLKSEVIGKAVYEDLPNGVRIMKSTKRFKVYGGWIYNTSTEFHNISNISVAEALVFVPE